jgi:hypothetical protein
LIETDDATPFVVPACAGSLTTMPKILMLSEWLIMYMWSAGVPSMRSSEHGKDGSVIISPCAKSYSVGITVAPELFRQSGGSAVFHQDSLKKSIQAFAIMSSRPVSGPE